MAWAIKIVSKFNNKKKYIIPLYSISYVEDAVTDDSEGSTNRVKAGRII